MASMLTNLEPHDPSTILFTAAVAVEVVAAAVAVVAKVLHLIFREEQFCIVDPHGPLSFGRAGIECPAAYRHLRSNLLD